MQASHEGSTGGSSASSSSGGSRSADGGGAAQLARFYSDVLTSMRTPRHQHLMASTLQLLPHGVHRRSGSTCSSALSATASLLASAPRCAAQAVRRQPSVPVQQQEPHRRHTGAMRAATAMQHARRLHDAAPRCLFATPFGRRDLRSTSERWLRRSRSAGPHMMSSTASSGASRAAGDHTCPLGSNVAAQIAEASESPAAHGKAQGQSRHALQCAQPCATGTAQQSVVANQQRITAEAGDSTSGASECALAGAAELHAAVQGCHSSVADCLVESQLARQHNASNSRPDMSGDAGGVPATDQVIPYDKPLHSSTDLQRCRLDGCGTRQFSYDGAWPEATMDLSSRDAQSSSLSASKSFAAQDTSKIAAASMQHVAQPTVGCTDASVTRQRTACAPPACAPRRQQGMPLRRPCLDGNLCSAPRQLRLEPCAAAQSDHRAPVTPRVASSLRAQLCGTAQAALQHATGNPSMVARSLHTTISFPSIRPVRALTPQDRDTNGFAGVIGAAPRRS